MEVGDMYAIHFSIHRQIRHGAVWSPSETNITDVKETLAGSKIGSFYVHWKHSARKASHTDYQVIDDMIKILQPML